LDVYPLEQLLSKFTNRPEQRISATVILAHDLDLDLGFPSHQRNSAAEGEFPSQH
jgi:hypothetical protein